MFAKFTPKLGASLTTKTLSVISVAGIELSIKKKEGLTMYPRNIFPPSLSAWSVLSGTIEVTVELGRSRASKFAMALNAKQTVKSGY